MNRMLLLICLLMSAKSHVFSQDDQERTLIGNPTDMESASNICADPAGNKYLAGKSDNKGLIIKQNASHQMLWVKTLRFTSNPVDEVSIAFLDVVGDTIFGCGKIHQGATLGIGSFYFKMNAQTGTMYWSKYEASGVNYFSCMRYADGKYFLIGGSYNDVTNLSTINRYGKVMAVSSQTGQMIWQTEKLNGIYMPTSPFFYTSFLSSTEMVNGKMYITGHVSYLANTGGYPFLIGIDENGTIFLQKYINVPNNFLNSNNYAGVRIELDQDQNLIMGVNKYLDGLAPSSIYSFLLKCDTLGNLIFAKQYPYPMNHYTVISSINETPTSYVIHGTNYPLPYTHTQSHVLKVSKNGDFEKAVSITKPNTTYYSMYSFPFIMGNSTFINGKHYFPTTESAIGMLAFDTDINQFILDEDLNMFEDCTELNELNLVATDVPLSISHMWITNVISQLSFSNGGVLEDLVIQEPCVGLSLDLVETPFCNQSIISANVEGFTVPTFHWSDGTVSTTNTQVVNTTDTVIVRVLDTKCCELIDTIVPALAPYSFVMNLPADTTICLQPGSSFTISPTFSGQNGTVQYLWSDNSTGSSFEITNSGTYWVDMTDTCSTKRDSIVVVVNSLPVIGNSDNLTVCEDDFPVTLNPTISAGATVLWDDGSTVIPRSVSAPGTYAFSVTNDCGTVDSSITVFEINLPDVELVSFIDTCIQNGASILLTPVFTGTTGILWSNGSTGNQLPVSSSGSYTVYASNSCGVDSAFCSVTINPFPELDLPTTLDTCFEIGAGFSYTAQGSAGSYQWSSGSQSATEWIAQEGIYSCTLTNVCGSITNSMQVRRVPSVDLYFPEDSILDCQKQLSVSLLHIETNDNLEIFAPYHGVVGTSLTESGWYQIHAFNKCWHKWDSIFVNLQNEQFFFLPNSFTPNGDSNNERFEFKGENVEVQSIRIFNRWGEEIFSQTGNFTGWDGTYQGEACPTGMYAVSVIYEDCFGIPAEFNGHVNLIR